MEEKSKRVDSDANVRVHIDEAGRQYVDLKDLVSQPSVRKTLQELQARFPGTGGERNARSSNRGG